jgi:hypothetical protein
MTKFKLVTTSSFCYQGLKERTAGFSTPLRSSPTATGAQRIGRTCGFSLLFRRIEFPGAYVLPRGVTGWALALRVQGFEEAYQRRYF